MTLIIPQDSYLTANADKKEQRKKRGYRFRIFNQVESNSDQNEPKRYAPPKNRSEKAHKVQFEARRGN